MKKQILLSLGVWFLAQSAFAGGGLIGSGGDGLLVSTDAMPTAGDVVVPVPGEISSYGQLQVVGEAGPEQSSIFLYTKCERGRNGKAARFSCKNGNAGALNERVSLTVGYYELFYSGSQYPELVEVKKNQLQVVELRKIQVPKVNGMFSVEVFRDLTNPLEQDKALWNMFSNANNRSRIEEICKREHLKAKAACAAYRSGDYRNLLESVIRFEENGSWSALSAKELTFKNQGRRMITDPKDGDFISVFPGVYGIIFTDSTTGQQVTQYGVRVD